jgi:selenocysteine lyase/cysteine desulfurase
MTDLDVGRIRAHCRLGFAVYTTEEDVDRAGAAVGSAS